jgi:hypothetical protein
MLRKAWRCENSQTQALSLDKTMMKLGIQKTGKLYKERSGACCIYVIKLCQR